MSQVRIIEAVGRSGERAFIALPFSLYNGNPRWVPWFNVDMRRILRRKHPFFRHSEGTFFLALSDSASADAKNSITFRQTVDPENGASGFVVGRVCVVENTRYNEEHGTRTAHFYFLDAVPDMAVFRALLDAAADWSRQRGLSELAGPMLFGGATGSGILIQGFDHRSAMTMMNYNHDYYAPAVEEAGFRKLIDFYSFKLDPGTFRLDPRVSSVAQKVLARGRFRVLRFGSKRDLLAYAPQIAALYNDTLADHTEGYPLTDAELKQVISDLTTVADPSLIKILTYDDAVVGFLFGFPDLSDAIQRSAGKLNPLSILRLIREFKRTNMLIVNGAGILPKYQRLGGNALLYYELERTISSKGGGKKFIHADLTQIAETTELMLSDLKNLGAEPYKVHRMYVRDI